MIQHYDVYEELDKHLLSGLTLPELRLPVTIPQQPKSIDYSKAFAPPKSAHFMNGWIAYKDILVADGVRRLEDNPDERNWCEHPVSSHSAVARVIHRLREQAIIWAKFYKRDDMLEYLLDSNNRLVNPRWREN